MGQVRIKTTVKLRASGRSQSHSRTDIAIRDLQTTIDEPVERGGTNLGPTPTDTALAALIGCTNVIGNKCAESLGVDIGTLDVSVTCDFDRRGVTLSEEIAVPFVKIDQVVTASGPATEDDLQKVAEEVAKYCPLSKLFEAAGTQLNTTWRKP